VSQRFHRAGFVLAVTGAVISLALLLAALYIAIGIATRL
jgi:hypothetical protein